MSGVMERLSNRYRLVDCIGTGGMSVVWLARDEILDRDVVVKLLGPQRPGDDSSRDLIRKEAMAAAGLAHPNVTTVYDYGEVNFPDGETVPFVVMEYVRGRTLASRLSEGPLPWQDAVRMAAEIAAALAAAHAHGLVHRDVKPGNVMLTPNGVKVLDFGIAVAVGTPDEGNVLLGTPAYVAPERLAGGPVHPAADVYAVGLLLYKALLGRLPWTASTATQILQSHRTAIPQPLPDIPGMPREVADICMRCLAKKPSERPDSATLARQLATLAGVRIPIPEPTDPPTATLMSGSLVQRMRRWTDTLRNRPMLSRVAAGGSAIGVLVMLVAWLAAPGGSDKMRATMGPSGDGHGDQTISCNVRYQTRSAGAGDYRADMAITNTGRTPIKEWTLSFELPDNQQVNDGDGAAWTQSGNAVQARGLDPDATIAPGDTATVGYAAAIRDRQYVVPDRFSLNGSTCEPTIVTTAVPTTSPQPRLVDTGRASDGSKGAGRAAKPAPPAKPAKAPGKEKAGKG